MEPGAEDRSRLHRELNSISLYSMHYTFRGNAKQPSNGSKGFFREKLRLRMEKFVFGLAACFRDNELS
jgi:hypothetical protein